MTEETHTITNNLDALYWNRREAAEEMVKDPTFQTVGKFLAADAAREKQSMEDWTGIYSQNVIDSMRVFAEGMQKASEVMRNENWIAEASAPDLALVQGHINRVACDLRDGGNADTEAARKVFDLRGQVVKAAKEKDPSLVFI